MAETPNWQTFVDEVKANPPVRRGKKIPYVMWGFIGNRYEGGVPHPEPTYAVLDMSGDKAQIGVLNHYHQNGYKLLHFWFPETLGFDDLKRLGKPTAFQELATHCAYLQASDPALAQTLAAKNAELEAKLDVMSRKIAEADGRQSKRNG
jgi:hypothetical protein